MKTLQQIADAIAASLRAIAPGRKLEQDEVTLINAIAELFHRREGASPFSKALAAVLKHEGGYSNHPADPGGSTMSGITQRTYDDWRRRAGIPPRSVRDITAAEIAAIYRRDYWDAVKGDELPAGVAYAAFDFAVNSGASRASKYLQAAAGVAQDGVIGPATVAAVKADPAGVITRLMDARVKFLKGQDTFDTFGRGWMRRCDDVRRLAGEMCS